MSFDTKQNFSDSNHFLDKEMFASNSIAFFVFHNGNFLSNFATFSLCFFNNNVLPQPTTFQFSMMERLVLNCTTFLFSMTYIEGSQAKWCISSMIYSRDIPFWSGTVNTWVGVKNFGFTEKQKNIEQGSTKLKELHVCIMRFQKKMAAWRSEEP